MTPFGTRGGADETFMSLTTRAAVASFDDVLASVHLHVPDAAAVVVSWARSHQSCAVMGLLDDDGAMLEVNPDLLVRLTGLFASPVGVEALQWSFPGADLSGSVVLNVGVDEPVSGLFAETVFDHVVNGLPVSDGAIRDALFLLLDAVALPAGGVRMSRQVIVPELPEDTVFEPVELWERPDGSGAVLAWADAVRRFPQVSDVGRVISVLANALAVRAERAKSLATGQAALLTDVVVPI